MTRTDSTKRPDVEVVTATVVDGTLAAGDVADAPVPWWSFTKTVLAAAALVLVDAGRLTLDAPLAGRAIRCAGCNLRALAITGPRRHHDALRAVGRPGHSASCSHRYSHAPGFEPGTNWMYSNVGYLFVRQLIEHATGEEIGEALSHLVLTPLGIVHAGFARRPEELIGTRWGNAGTYHPGWVYHGLMVGSPAAAALLLDRLLRGDLLSSASLRAMRESFRLGAPIPGRPWPAPGHGLGLTIETTAPRSFMCHTGQGPARTGAVYPRRGAR